MKTALPHPNQQPDDDVAQAMSLVRMTVSLLEARTDTGLDGSDVLDVLVTLDHDSRHLRPLLRLLKGADFPGMMDRFRTARLETINAKD